MLSLHLFGGASLDDEAGPVTGPATQRRRLALLAFLAAAPRGSASRDRLTALFWPDEERDRARHFLADSVFSLRKGLGKDSILTVGDDLVLSREVVDCDVWRFHDALAEGDAERAVLAYRGAFLDGFFVSDGGEFERWVEEERARLARLHSEALERLAEEAERRGEHAGALRWWRLLAAQDPYSSRVALRLMQALAAAGDRVAAMRHARVHSTLLREELEIDPDPEVLALAARLAALPEAPHPSPEIVPAAVAPVVPAGPSPRLAPPAAPQPPRRRRYTVAAIPLLVLALLGGMAAIWASGRPVASPSASDADAALPRAPVLAVLPFDYRGAPEHAYLREGLVTLLSTSLNGAGALRPVDPYALLGRALAASDGGSLSPDRAGALAADLGADLFVLGTVVASADRLHITASLHRVGGDPAAVRRVAVEGSDVFVLVDDLSRQFLAGELEGPADRLAQLAVLTTPSLPALRAYLQGEEDFRAARYPEAAVAFRRAVREDPSFALAYYRLSAAAEWSFGFVEARQAAEQALRLSEGLSPRDRLLVAAWHRFVTGDAAEAERLFNAILADHPGDVEAWSGLGEVRLHYNPVQGRPVDEAMPAFRTVLRLAPNYGEARFHLLEAAAGRGDVAAFDSLLAGVDPAGRQMLSWRAAREHAWGPPAEHEALAERLRDAEEVVVGIAAARAAANFRDLEGAEALARLLTDAARPDAWRAAGHIFAAQTALARGEWGAAEADLAAAGPIEPGWALETRALGSLLPLAPPDPLLLRATRAELERWDPGRSSPETAFFFAAHADVHAQLRLYLLAMLSIRLGDEDAAAGYLRELRPSGQTREGREFVRALVASVQAHQAAAGGDHAGALRLLEEGGVRAPLERIALSPFFARAPDRYLRAESLRALGRTEEALRWYASLTEGPDFLYWAAAHRRQAELRPPRP